MRVFVRRMHVRADQRHPATITILLNCSKGNALASKIDSRLTFQQADVLKASFPRRYEP